MELLQDAVKQYGPLCVGLDTDSSYIPKNILSLYENPAFAVLDYNKKLIDAIVRDKTACCFKVQIAYYEAMGICGMEAYSKTLKYIKSKNFIAISDVKRGDIASTAEAYARAHFLGDFETDIITINPYMGFDTLKPFLEFCKTNGKGIFVLLRTSNTGMVDIEQRVLSASQGALQNSMRVLDVVGTELERILCEMNKIFPNQKCSPCGAVVGCTEESDAQFLREAHPNLFFLIPGYGAQGGDVRICATLLKDAGGVVNSSRGILCAWKKDALLKEKRNSETLAMEDIVESATRAALLAKKDLMNCITKNGAQL